MILFVVSTVHGYILNVDESTLIAQAVAALVLGGVSFLSLQQAEVDEWPMGSILWPLVRTMQRSLAGEGGAPKVCCLAMLCCGGLGYAGGSQGFIAHNKVLW